MKKYFIIAFVIISVVFVGYLFEINVLRPRGIIILIGSISLCLGIDKKYRYKK